MDFGALLRKLGGDSSADVFPSVNVGSSIRAIPSNAVYQARGGDADWIHGLSVRGGDRNPVGNMPIGITQGPSGNRSGAPTATPTRTTGTPDSNTDNLVGGGIAYDPIAALQAQQTSEAQAIQDRLMGRRGEVDKILNDILGRVDSLLEDRKRIRDQQYGFDTEALVDSLKGSIPEIEKAFASLGLSNSTFVGDRRDDTSRQYQLSQGATDRALASDLAEYGQWADTEKSKARTNASDMKHTFDSIGKMTPNHMNLSNLQQSELDLNKGISGFKEQTNRFTTSGDALRALNSIGSDYDFDNILNSFATTAASKADTGSGGGASQAVLDNIRGNTQKKRLTENQINNPVGAATA